MKKILFLLISLIFIAACAKPEVAKIKQPGDYNLNCNELESGIEEAQKLKKDAEYARTGTGGNVSRLLLFWPAWAQSLHNADKAIIAAENRTYHLKKIMKNKNCSNLKALNTDSNFTNTSSKGIGEQLKILRDLRESGDLTEKEFKQAKEKILK